MELIRDRRLDSSDLVKINKAYSSEPWWYDIRGFLILTFAYRSTLPAQVKLFSNNFGKEHLEIAVGSGTLLDIILKWRRFTKKSESHITAFDYAERMLAGAIKRFSARSDIEFLLADAAKLPFANNTFDTANIANALHCLPEVSKSLNEVSRVLKRNGTLAGNALLYPKGSSILDKISNKINIWGMKKGILHTPYNEEEIVAHLEESGFKIVYKKITGNCLDFIAQKN